MFPSPKLPAQGGMVKAHPHVHSAVLALPEPKMVAWNAMLVLQVVHATDMCQAVLSRVSLGGVGLPEC